MSDPFNEIEEQLFNVIRIDISNDCELPVDCFLTPVQQVTVFLIQLLKIYQIIVEAVGRTII